MNDRASRIHWCCRFLRDAFTEAGHSGLGIFVDDSAADRPQFLMQFRALEPSAPVPASQAPLTVNLETAIQYCPWCGQNLSQFYANHISAMARNDLVFRCCERGRRPSGCN